MSQSECLNKTREQHAPGPRFNCSIQYSPLRKQFETVIRKHWYITESDPALSNLFPHSPCIVYKKTPNLRNNLVRADLPPLSKPHFLNDIPQGNYRYGQCAQCNFTSKCNTFQQPWMGKNFKIKGIITCNTSNVIYMPLWSCLHSQNLQTSQN